MGTHKRRVQRKIKKEVKRKVQAKRSQQQRTDTHTIAATGPSGLSQPFKAYLQSKFA